MVLMHTEAREDLGACPSRNIKCSEITSEAIFGSKQPPEQVVQYSNLTFAARQECASQPSINVAFLVICWPQIF